SFTIDKTSPVISVSGVSDGTYYKADVAPVITVTDANLAGSTITLNGAPFVSGTTVSAEGSYTLAVEASDKAGNTAQTTVTFTIDKTVPVITVTGVTDGSYYKTDVIPVITVTETNLASSSITLNGNTFESGTAVSTEGGYALVVQATDKAGNTAQVSISFTIDKTAPVISVSVVSDGTYYKADVAPVCTVADANPAGSTITLNGGPFISGTTVSAEGVYTLAVETSDKAGNTAQTTVTFTIDKTVPVITVTGVTDGSYYKTDVVPVITVIDANLQSSSISLNGAPFTSGTPVSAEGSYTLAVEASDKAGNTASMSLTFTIDKTAPAVSIIGVTDGVYYNTDVIPEITITDLYLDASSITLNGEPYISGMPISIENNYVLVIQAADRAGNTRYAEVTFTIDKTPPTINVSGVSNGSYYHADVTPLISVIDLHLAAQTVTLNGAPFVSGTTISAEGGYTLAINAGDLAGNSAQATISFTIDKTPPAISVSGVSDGIYYKVDVAPVITVTDANPAGSTITLNGAPFVSGTTVSAEGSYTLAVETSDKAGNTAQITVAFTIDKTPPVITVSGVTDGSYSKVDVTPVITVTDANPAGSTMTLNGSPFVSGTTVSAEGVYTLAVETSDKAGNTASKSLAFTIDKIAPVISVSGVSDGVYYQTDVVPAITVTDANLASSAITLNGAPFTSGTTVSAEGGYILAVQAMDKAGNSASKSLTFTIDKTAPIVSITGVNNAVCYPYSVTPVVTASDANLLSLSSALNGAAFVSGTVVSAEGDYLLASTANDRAGNTKHVEVNFTIDRTKPVIAITGVENGHTYTGTVTPVIGITDPHLKTESVSITLNGAPFVSGTTINSSGSYILAVSAQDCAGNPNLVQVNFVVSLVGGLPVFNYGICAFDWVALSNNSTIRSYNPGTGLLGDEGRIAAQGNLNLINNAKVRGDTVVGGNLLMANNAHIYGTLYIDGGSITIHNNAGISGSTIHLPVPPQPCECGYDLEGILAGKQADNDNAVLLADPTIVPFIVNGSLVITNNHNVTLPSGDYYFTSIYLSNNAKLIISAGAQVNLFVEDNVQISNNAKIVNPLSNQADLNLICGTDATQGEVFYLMNNAGVKVNVYAPLADVVMEGNADLYGAIVGKSFTGANNSKILLDESLLGEGSTPPLTCE
ncbi:MAG: Ig-like domain-containing protein, partial [bacterium]|nr:Ig-like domain-containing protein [bacterium]